MKQENSSSETSLHFKNVTAQGSREKTELQSKILGKIYGSIMEKTCLDKSSQLNILT